MEVCKLTSTSALFSFFSIKNSLITYADISTSIPKSFVITTLKLWKKGIFKLKLCTSTFKFHKDFEENFQTA